MIAEHYYTPTGEKITREKIVEDMIKHYKEELPTSIADFSEGTEIRNLLESFALSYFVKDYYTNMEFRNHFLIYAEGTFLDNKGIELGLPRKEGTRASGFVTITIPASLDEDFIIEESVTFTNPNTNINYIIYKNATQITENYEYKLLSGETSVLIPVICEEIGKIGNTDAGTIIDFYEQPPIDNATVTNVEMVTGGTDSETDEEYRLRLLMNEKNNSFGSKPFYQTLLLDIDGVHDTYLTYEDEAVKVYVNGDNKPVTDAVLVECAELLNKDINHQLGHDFNFYKANYYTIHMRIEINSHNTLSEQDIKNRILNLIDGGTDHEQTFYGLSMGETLSESDVISAITSLEGIDSVVPYIANENGEYERFSKLICQDNEVIYVEHIEVIFRE